MNYRPGDKERETVLRSKVGVQRIYVWIYDLSGHDWICTKCKIDYFLFKLINVSVGCRVWKS